MRHIIDSTQEWRGASCMLEYRKYEMIQLLRSHRYIITNRNIDINIDVQRFTLTSAILISYLATHQIISILSLINGAHLISHGSEPMAH